MYRNRTYRRTMMLLALLAGMSLRNLPAENPRDILARARALPSVSASLLLEANLAGSGAYRPYYLLDLARLAASDGNWQKSLEWSLMQDRSAIPSGISDSVVRWTGEALVRTGKTGEASRLYLDRLETGQVADPLLYLSYFRIGESGSAELTARFDAAFPLLKHTDPGTFALSRYLGGLCAVRGGDWDFAVQSLSRFSPSKDAQYPEYAPWSHFYLAYSLYRLGRWDESVSAFTVYLDTWRNHDRSWEAAMTASLAAIQAGLDPLPLTGRAVALAPSGNPLAESLLLRASVLLDRRFYPDAGKLLEGVADGSSTGGMTASAPRAAFMLAETEALQKDNDAAAERWLSLVARWPKDPLAEEALYRPGELWYVAGNYPKAAELLARYRQLWPSGRFLDAALRSGGDAYRRTGRTDLAILWWEELVRKFPDSPEIPRTLRNLVAAYREKGEYAEAANRAEAYRKRFPSESALDDMDRELAELRALSRGESPDAAVLREAYTKAGGAAAPEGRAAGLRLARLYLADFGQRDEALKILKDIAAAAPRAPEGLKDRDRSTLASVWMLLGTCGRESGDFRTAAAAFLSAGTLFAPLDGERAAEALFGAVDCFAQAGLAGDARTTSDTLKKNWPDSVWTRRAALLME